ncbi:hypothetical protein JCM10212_006201 [Sporobolomyces blumeae]
MTTSHDPSESPPSYIRSLLQPLARAGMGIPTFSHPLHPATVHLPVGLLTLSYSLDAVQVVPHLAQGLTWLKVLPPVAVINTLSHYVGAAGLLFAIPTVLTGLSELFGLWKKQVDQKDTVAKTVEDAATAPPLDVSGEKLKIAITHASLNTVVLGVGLWNWWIRRTDRDLVLPQHNAWISTLAIPLFYYSASLGGELVYKYGMGVKRQGSAKDIKAREDKGENA